MVQVTGFTDDACHRFAPYNSVNLTKNEQTHENVIFLSSVAHDASPDILIMLPFSLTFNKYITK
jgi:hypothetical protein